MRRADAHCKRCGKMLRKNHESLCAVTPAENRKKRREYWQVKRRAARAAIMLLYGGKCACCDERGLEFLTLDHFKGNGEQHRLSLRCPRGNTSSLYLRMLKEKKRNDIRILCANCHMAIDMFGACPHSFTRKENG